MLAVILLTSRQTARNIVISKVISRTYRTLYNVYIDKKLCSSTSSSCNKFRLLPRAVSCHDRWPVMFRQLVPTMCNNTGVVPCVRCVTERVAGVV